MTLALLAGCAMVAFGAPAVLFFMIVCRWAHLFIISIVGAFFWFSSYSLAAIIWYMIEAMQSITVLVVLLEVLIQEAGRYLFFRLYAKTEKSFSVVSTNAVAFPMIDFYSALASGVGYGVTYSVMIYGSVISHSWGSGTLFSEACPQISAFVVAAVNASIFGLLHIVVMIAAFDAYRRESRNRILFVLLTFILASLIPMLTPQAGCSVSLPLLGTVLLIASIYTTHVVCDPGYRSKKKLWGYRRVE